MAASLIGMFVAQTVLMMRDRSLDDLAPTFRPLAMELLARLTEAGIPVMVIETLRTEEQHIVDVANGRSWVSRSKHQDGLAIDICPYSLYNIHGADKLEWDANDPIWQEIGKVGAKVGFVGNMWGGNWTQKDMGHFEL